MTRYRIVKEDIIGHSKDDPENYDLMEVIMIRRGDAEIDEEIFDFLNGIFKSETERVNRYTGDDPVIAEEVKKMGGFGAALVEKTEMRAKAEGREERPRRRSCGRPPRRSCGRSTAGSSECYCPVHKKSDVNNEVDGGAGHGRADDLSRSETDLYRIDESDELSRFQGILSV